MIEEALRFCSEQNLAQVVLAVPSQLSITQLEWLRQHSLVCGVITRNIDPSASEKFGTWLGAYLPDDYTWRLPIVSARTIVYAGMRNRITFRMTKVALQSGFRDMVFLTPRGWVKKPLLMLVYRRIQEHVAIKVQQLVRPLGKLFARVYEGSPDVYKQLLAQARKVRSRPKDIVRGRVVLVNSALAPGGAERQIVNTITGLIRHNLEPILLCEDLYTRRGHDFYLPKLRDLGIQVREVRRESAPSDLLELYRNFSLMGLYSKIPGSIADEIMNLHRELSDLRPEIVHAWQDSTSIKAGIAAILAGVPRVVLSSRNVSPPHFAYHRPYMRPGYRALAECENVVLVNNSQAGVDDFAKWLGIPPTRFKVIRNGVELSGLRRAEASQAENFRAQHGIPTSARLVGSIFRFWPEKRPFLWIRMAAKIAEQMPDVHFLIVGWGSARQKMEGLRDRLGLRGRLHFSEERPDITTALSTMDVFVLTSQFEGTPNVVLESQWLGVPVIATKAGGTREAIEDGRTGWIVDPATPSLLADQVVRILRDSAAVAQAKVRGPEFIREHFGMDRMIRETLAAYGVRSSEDELLNRTV